MTTRIPAHIRRATPDDIEVLVGFNAAMAKETEGLSLDQDTLTEGTKAVFRSPEKGYYLVAEAGDGQVVGSLLCVEEWSDWRNETFWWIQSVYVRPDWRRQGVYRSLHNHVYEAAKATLGVCGVRLYVDRNNHNAQATYSSLGMTKSHYDLFEIDLAPPQARLILLSHHPPFPHHRTRHSRLAE